MWNKKIIISLMVFCLLPLVSAVCCEINENCTIIETCQDGDCGNCYLTLYNQSGIYNQSGVMANVSDYTYQFNTTIPLNEFGSYPYVINCSTGDECVDGCYAEVKQNCEVESMDALGMIIGIPIFLAFFYLILSYLFKGKAHWALSLAFVFLAFIEFFRAYNYAVITLGQYYNVPDLINNIGSTVYNYGVMYTVVIMYFLIHMIVVMTMYIWNAKKKNKKIGEYGEY